MPRDFYPRREADIQSWTSNFRNRIESDPQRFSITAQQAEAYAVVQQRFADLYRAAHSPTERTPSIITAKGDAREALEAATRSLAARIGAASTTTVEMRVELGLALRRRGGHHRELQPPEQPPRLVVQSIKGRIATLVVSDRTGLVRRKPRGARAVTVWCYAPESDEQPPLSLREWKLVGQSTRTINRLAFDAKLPAGTMVWLAACWMSPTGKQGRPCEPVRTCVGFGGPLAMESVKAARMLYVPQFVKKRETQTLALALAA